jgi:dGTPase
VAKADHYRQEVKAAIERAVAAGNRTLEEILSALGSPDPRLVKELFDEVCARFSEHLPHSEGSTVNAMHARRLCANLPLELPASDSMVSQWWFTLESIVRCAESVWRMSSKLPAVFLGAPTVGYYYSQCYNAATTILDVDQDVVGSLGLPSTGDARVYDVADALPGDLAGKHSVIFMDPPWYDTTIRLFIARGRQLLMDEGFILCILPSRLTREEIVEERTALLSELLAAHFEIVCLESDFVRYRVPEFESMAFGDIARIETINWRRGDLLVLRVQSSSGLTVPEPETRRETVRFAQDIRKLRVFLRPERAVSTLQAHVERIPEYERTVSTRNIPLDRVGVWTTNRRGAAFRDTNVCQIVLSLWAEGKTPAMIASELEKNGYAGPNTIVQEFQESLQLWGVEETPRFRRRPAEIAEHLKDYLSIFAAQPSVRRYEFSSDGFRQAFQRDRDCILWSTALRRLAGKTQCFPVEHDDLLRGRLAHSVEVLQLASTIAVSFGLDRDLTEAGALAHDVGHTPFGHAGEYALNSVLNEINPGLGGFNHYEHGVDIVRWLEDTYQSPGIGGFPGLNLTPETVECIFKHTYFRGDEVLGQHALARATKHEDLQTDTSCHVEGQAIRIADKVSYLISDLEDGIRLGIIDQKALARCRFFDRPPIDMEPSRGESLLDRFISQRRAILKVIMEDILTATDARLRQAGSLQAVRNTPDYVVTYSKVLEDDINQIWVELQAGRLHQDPRVRSENDRAAKMVRELLLVYAMFPHLIDAKFRESYQRLEHTEYLDWYVRRAKESMGIPKRLVSKYAVQSSLRSDLHDDGDNWRMPTWVTIMAKDYVAGLTDRRALQEFRRHCAYALAT